MSSETVTLPEPVLTNTVKQAAIRTGLSERTLWLAISRKQLKSVRIGGRVLIPEQALRSFLGLQAATLRGGRNG
jgi:excisionase family DNA binding protein